jgi:hypothetical protein
VAGSAVEPLAQARGEESDRGVDGTSPSEGLQPVRSLRHLIQVIESRDTGLLVLETHEGKQVVLDRERARREGPAILARYQVPSDRSFDLVATTGAGPARTVAAPLAAGPGPGYPPAP